MQLSVYRGTGGIQALLTSKARKLAEQDESIVVASGIPYTIIRAGSLQSTPGGKQGFSFEEVLLIFMSIPSSTDWLTMLPSVLSCNRFENRAVIPLDIEHFSGCNGSTSNWNACIL